MGAASYFLTKYIGKFFCLLNLSMTGVKANLPKKRFGHKIDTADSVLKRPKE
jgi:hypothetical protein